MDQPLRPRWINKLLELNHSRKSLLTTLNKSQHANGNIDFLQQSYVKKKISIHNKKGNDAARIFQG